MTFSLVLDILIAILLIATITYAVMLNRRLSDLRKDQSDLDRLAKSFNDATLRAEESISKLTGSSQEMKRDIQDTLAKAEALRDDLNFLIERASQSADKLEDSVRHNRPEPPAYAGKKVKDTVAPPTQKASSKQPESSARFEEKEDDYKPKTDAERELLKALQSVR
jgi:chromosome segregation ATPase